MMWTADRTSTVAVWTAAVALMLSVLGVGAPADSAPQPDPSLTVAWAANCRSVTVSTDQTKNTFITSFKAWHDGRTEADGTQDVGENPGGKAKTYTHSVDSPSWISWIRVHINHGFGQPDDHADYSCVDADADGVIDGQDNCPDDANPTQADLDGDGTGDPCDADADGDGTDDALDNCPGVRNDSQTDTDGDGTGDACDGDVDGDDVINDTDNCPLTPNADQTDTDGDGVGDACDDDTVADGDADGVPDASDNCPGVANAQQRDLDGDGVGDACDDDVDGDGAANATDNCPGSPNPDQSDLDGDDVGDACDPDVDGDGPSNDVDNCPQTPNPDQADADGDGVGDACDVVTDSDGDGAPDASDNCPDVANPEQTDTDGDGLGDACDPDPGGGTDGTSDGGTTDGTSGTSGTTTDGTSGTTTDGTSGTTDGTSGTTTDGTSGTSGTSTTDGTSGTIDGTSGTSTTDGTSGTIDGTSGTSTGGSSTSGDSTAGGGSTTGDTTTGGGSTTGDTTTGGGSTTGGGTTTGDTTTGGGSTTGDTTTGGDTSDGSTTDGSTTEGSTAGGETTGGATTGGDSTGGSTTDGGGSTGDDAAGGGQAGGGGATLVDTGERLAGPDRWGTAVAVSKASYPTDRSANVVVLARGDDPYGYADALAGTPLAYALNGPMLITLPSMLVPDVEAELVRVLAPGRTVHVLGGPVAIEPEVAQRIQQLGYVIERHEGPTRIETAVAIAEKLGNPDRVLLATGWAFPDALSAGAAAAAHGAAVLLTNDAQPAPATQRWLSRNAADLYAIGGPAARAHPEASSIVGQDREETAALVGTWFFPQPTAVGLAFSYRFPDALTGGVHAARAGGPVLLSPSNRLHAAPARYTCTHERGITSAYVYGGPAAIDAPTAHALFAHADGSAC